MEPFARHSKHFSILEKAFHIFHNNSKSQALLLSNFKIEIKKKASKKITRKLN
jgi:hypothetical protein